jgi:hypothetical protein
VYLLNVSPAAVSQALFVPMLEAFACSEGPSTSRHETQLEEAFTTQASRPTTRGNKSKLAASPD